MMLEPNLRQVRQRQRDENLMMVAAVEQYANKYKMSTGAAFRLFRQHNVNMLIRKYYGALHTQPLEESFLFADDILKRKIHAD